MYDMVDLGFIYLLRKFNISRHAKIKRTHLDAMELVTGHTEEHGSDIVETGKPDLAGMVTNGHRNDVPADGKPSHHQIDKAMSCILTGTPASRSCGHIFHISNHHDSP